MSGGSMWVLPSASSHAVADALFAGIREETVRAQARVNAWYDVELRRMLGLWVSEIEPVVVYGPNHEMLGLGIAGSGEMCIVVPARRLGIIGNAEGFQAGAHSMPSAAAGAVEVRWPRPRSSN